MGIGRLLFISFPMILEILWNWKRSKDEKGFWITEYISYFLYYYFLISKTSLSLIETCFHVNWHDYWFARGVSKTAYSTLLPLFLFIYSHVHILFGPFLPPSPHPHLFPHPFASMQNLFCPSLQFCWREDITNNKKDKAFLLVEIRIAIQGDS
jgi:hypothetical protein